MSKLTVERTLSKGNGHNAIILKCESPVGDTAAGSMGNLAPPMDYDSVSGHSSAERCGEWLRT